MQPFPFNFEMNLKTSKFNVQTKITKSGGKVSFKQQEMEPSEFHDNSSFAVNC